MSFFPIWDDAYLSRGVVESAPSERLEFGAITRANMVTRDLLRAMRRAGLRHVNFGVESGDDSILKAIKKGIRTEHVVRALEWAKEEELATACNFMLGFPQEDEAALDRTRRFMGTSRRCRYVQHARRGVPFPAPI
jgi:radical SAM superfamily enzyme YgiQ (UPF0313 family)